MKFINNTNHNVKSDDVGDLKVIQIGVLVLLLGQEKNHKIRHFLHHNNENVYLRCLEELKMVIGV